MNENNKEITVEQLLRITAENLNRIPVSISQIETVGIPIKQAIDNINACIAVFERAAKQVNKEPEIKVEEMEPVSADEVPEGIADRQVYISIPRGLSCLLRNSHFPLLNHG